jgi:NAD(P)-dependent dehydrogenase (short-subunit alcohol dehydrogenase family)
MSERDFERIARALAEPHRFELLKTIGSHEAPMACVAQVAVFLASDASGWLTGERLKAAGGHQ